MKTDISCPTHVQFVQLSESLSTFNNGTFNNGSPFCTPRPLTPNGISPKLPYNLDHCFGPALAASPKVREISDLYMKLFGSPKGQQNRILNDKVPTTGETSSNVPVTRTRGVRRPLDELSSKLERFKIRTVRLGDGVQDEKERK